MPTGYERRIFNATGVGDLESDFEVKLPFTEPAFQLSTVD